jgi:hypothetical protein
MRGACGAVSTNAHAFGVEHLVEHVGELAVAVPDQEFERVDAFTEVEHEVAGLLRDPRPGRVRRDAQDMDAAGGVLDYGEAVQPREGDRLDREEIARQNPLCLRAQELAPGGPASARRGVDAGLLEDRPDRRWGDAAAEFGELAGDSPVALLWVLGGHVQDQVSDAVPGRRASRPPPLVGPAPFHQIRVPAQKCARGDEHPGAPPRRQ